jgi:hypothetical protein
MVNVVTCMQAQEHTDCSALLHLTSSYVLHIHVQVIQETEAAYLKILESSQTLLTVLKRESINIQKKRQAAT